MIVFGSIFLVQLVGMSVIDHPSCVQSINVNICLLLLVLTGKRRNGAEDNRSLTHAIMVIGMSSTIPPISPNTASLSVLCTMLCTVIKRN